MKRRGFILGFLLVALVNAIVMGMVAYDRSGTPEASLEFTERELPLGYTSREDSERNLQFMWTPVSRPWDRRQKQWISVETLKAIGFDCSFPLKGQGAEEYYRREQKRKAYVVLEYKGAIWQARMALVDRMTSGTLEEQRKAYFEHENNDLSRVDPSEYNGLTSETLKSMVDGIRESSLRDSRLFAIDAGPSAEELRTKYPDRSHYAIVHGVLGLDYYAPEKQEPFLTAQIQQILVSSIHVPNQFRGIFEKFLADPFNQYQTDGGKWEWKPRYTVKLNFGKKLEPWIEEVREGGE